MIELKLLFIYCCILLSCVQTSKEPNTNKETSVQVVTKDTTQQLKVYENFDRTICLQRIDQKRANGEALVIHLKVPLCDNVHQGIVPVSEKLGNGFDLKNNLYWGPKYGIKNYFKRYTNWRLLHSEKDPNQAILERVIFYQKLSDGTQAYVVADAYRGDKMKTCLQGFLEASAGKNKQEITIQNQRIGIHGQADFLIFNGHNGLMEYDLEYVTNEDDEVRDMAIIACASHDYFKPHAKRTKAYPLLTTTNLMAPEAYVVHAAIMAWLKQSSEDQLETEVAKAYHQYQKCGLRAAKRLFKTGW